ncbi:MAG TPA: hypothetical protein VGJ15_05695 [Pirellulales bacterium]|jgi:hypothetical protein
MKFARNVFLIAGIYGLIGLVPPLFLETKMGTDYPPAITHPEYYYGFLGVGIAWQVAFIIISRDPLRYRPLLPAVTIEKFSFALAATVLFFQQRAPGLIFALGMVDLMWGALFIVAWTKLNGGRADS